MGGDTAPPPDDRVGIEQALTRLPQAYSLALRLRQTGISDEQLAMYLDIATESVTMFLRIAEDKLRAALAEGDAVQ
ncbi:hypothetical protein [Nocardia cyriacigeorgica]|uniref:hypothetical protein n=1 Tax=Nocardia cyriacigeorgica TaxID=135487 RepID=UPI00245818DA|nr:hypothetical protein [Nocardia cyriacigeorgica]